MIRKLFYPVTIFLSIAILSVATSCSDNSEESAESLARKLCDCEKISDTEKREKCLDNVSFELQFHLSDPVYMAAYNQAAQACYN